jgi:putative heme-binding domain-containing protein
MRLVSIGGVGAFAIAVLWHHLVALPSYSQDDPRLVAPTPPRTPEEERRGFRLPPGFEIQLVASEPDIHKPMNLAFDDRGRLWVTDTLEYPFPAPADRPGRDSVKILEDRDGDGMADRVITFADGLNIPIGILPVANGAIVYSIPNVYLMLDTDGDDRADVRQVLFGPFGYADTHGMVSSLTWGMDGWVYATHGFANTSTIRARDGSRITMHSGNTFRFTSDGSRVQQYTWGQVNPFGMSADVFGNLYTADCHSRPIMMLLRGAYYQSFGKPHDGLGFAPEICDSDHGSTGIAGIVYYQGGRFPPQFQDTIFVGNPVTNRINHDRTRRVGSTIYAHQQADFLTSEDPWFRPVNLVLGPDDALYVADFYNCIIGHYEVPLTHPRRDRERGRIWRIIYRGDDARPYRPPVADFAKASDAELVALLGHHNPTVRTKAANQLATRGSTCLPLVQAATTHADALVRQQALWVLERLEKLEAQHLSQALRDGSPLVRTAAARILSERAALPPEHAEQLLELLHDPDGMVRRFAADALGQHPSPRHIEPLLKAWAAAPGDDPQLVHTLRMALRNQLRPAEHWSAIKPDLLTSDQVRRLCDICLGLPTVQSAEFLMKHLGTPALEGVSLTGPIRHIARYGSPEAVGALTDFVRSHRPQNIGHQLQMLRAYLDGTRERGAAMDQTARGWAKNVLTQALSSADDGVVQPALETAAQLRLPALASRLREIAEDRRRHEDRRASAWQALIALDAPGQVAPLGELLGQGNEAATMREKAAALLASINSPQARAELVRHLPTAPARVQTAIAMGLAATREGAEDLLQAIAAGKASAWLLQERVVESRLRAAKPERLEERLRELTRGLPPADQQVAEIIQKRRSRFLAVAADPARGAKVFEQHCANCHTLAGKGARVGPQLDGIGIRGLERLLEDLIDPNRNVDQAFRASLILRSDGQLLQGLVLREEGAVVVLADDKGKELRIPAEDIAERKLSPLSPMPANLIAQIPEPEFYDLVAYLLQQRTPPAPTGGMEK